MQNARHFFPARLRTFFGARLRAFFGARLRAFFGARHEAIAGTAAIELGIIAPVLVLALICTFDLGLGIYRSMQVESAAQAGAEYAIARGYSVDGVTRAVANATSFTGVSADPAPFQFCGCAAASGVTSVTCGLPCPDGTAAGTYVTVSAQGTYNTFLPYPMFPNAYNFAAQSTVRTQ
jgi:Flp pilus assembly protein TadG